MENNNVSAKKEKNIGPIIFLVVAISLVLAICGFRQYQINSDITKRYRVEDLEKEYKNRIRDLTDLKDKVTKKQSDIQNLDKSELTDDDTKSVEEMKNRLDHLRKNFDQHIK